MTWVQYFISQLLWVTEAEGSPDCKFEGNLGNLMIPWLKTETKQG